MSGMAKTRFFVNKAFLGFKYCRIIAAICGYFIIFLGCNYAVVHASTADEDYINDYFAEKAYVEKVFLQAFSEIPRMAWLVKPDTIISDSKHETIYIYTDMDSVLKAKYNITFTKDQIAEIRNRNYVACDTEKVYYGFSSSTAHSGKIDRAFYTTKPLGKGIVVGYKNVKLNKAHRNRILSLKKISEKPGIHNYFAVAHKESSFIYSFHALFDKNTKGLFRSGIVLQDSQGRIIGNKFWDIDEHSLCDGCGLPEYKSDNPSNPQADMLHVFELINVFHFPGFEYPVLFMDTSTIEGRAISFATFEKNGKYIQYRDAEYVVRCILDSPY